MNAARRVNRFLRNGIPFVAILCVVALLFLPVACNTEACLDRKSSIMTVDFRAYGDTALAVRVDSLSVYGIGQPTDSLLLDRASVSSFQATLRSDKDTTQYVLYYDQYNLNPRYSRDTLTFIYHAYVQFETAECGAIYVYVIDEFRYTTWQIIQAEMRTPEIDNREIENVRLYYAVSESE